MVERYGTEDWGAVSDAVPVRKRLAFGDVVIELICDDPLIADWLSEFLAPSFASTDEPRVWRVRLSSAQHEFESHIASQRAEAKSRACFVLDQQTIFLPTWRNDARIAVADSDHSCFLELSRFDANLVVDPTAPRARVAVMRVFREIAATRLRPTHLDLHASAVEMGGRAVLITAPKRSGKTTLALHLLGSRRCRALANDRAFLGDSTTSFQVRGMPTIVTIGADLLGLLPQLLCNLGSVKYAALYSEAELTRAKAPDDWSGPPAFTLSLTQMANRLGVGMAASAPLAAIAFPEVNAASDSWAVERLAPADVSARLWANLYGGGAQRPPTIFEEIDVGYSVPKRHWADDAAHAVPGFRVAMGRGGFGEPEAALRLLTLLDAL